MEEKVRAVVADVLRLDFDDVEGSTSRDTTGTWDSLAHINLIVALEQEFGLTFEVAEIETMFTVDDILKTLSAKLPN